MKSFTAKTALLLLISVYGIVCASVTVLESTPSRLVLKWETTGFDTVTVGAGRAAATALSFDGGYAVTGDSGAAMIPGFSLYAGVPRQGNVKVTLDPIEVSVLRINSPLQKRTTARGQREPFFFSRWISEPSYTYLRDYRAASFVIRPVHDMGQGRIQLLKSARIVIEFPPAAHSGARWEPRSDHERMVKKLLSNFEVSQGWAQSERRALRKSVEEQPPFAFNQPLASFRINGAERGNEAAVKGNKLIKISGKRVRELFGNNVQISSVALFASVKGELADSVPPEGKIPAGVFEVPLLRPSRSGAVSNDDYFIAYVSGSSDWEYSSTGQKYSFALNRYDDNRAYWLTVKQSGSGETMSRFVQPPSSAAASGDFEANVYMRAPRALSKKSKVIAGGKEEGGGINWVWKRFDTGRSDTTIQLELPGLLTNKSGFISVDTAYSGGAEARLGSNTLCVRCAGNTVSDWSSTSLYINAANARSMELNGVHVRYRRSIAMPSGSAGDKLEIFSPASFGVTRYKLAKTGNELAYIVRVPIDERDVSLIDTVRGADYTWSDSGNLGTRYIVTAQNSIVDYSDSLTDYRDSLKSVSYYPPSNSYQIRDLRDIDRSYLIRDLRNTANRADYLIITHQEFAEAAVKLARHKKTDAGFSYPKVVLLSDLQNQFSGGSTDPASIRNFLLYVYRNWNFGNNLDYVTLIGSAHYDYKYVNARETNFMPAAYRTDGTINTNRAPDYNRVTDDYFVFFDTLTHPDKQHEGFYFLGRLPARSASEASDMVNKIIDMESPAAADFDSWRNRVLLTADDDQQGQNADLSTPEHYRSSECIDSIILKNRPETDVRKVYLFEYPWNEYYMKPRATRAFINEINDGVAAVNWFGHGGADLIADERLFAMSDVTALHNRKRYPVFSLFSCSIGQFDIPSTDCLAAQLVRQPNAGAIGVISAARVTYASYNEQLAKPYFSALFHPTDNLSVGAALRYGKYQYKGAGSDDNRFYILLGDPSITFSKRNREVDISIEDASGKKIDTLKALQQIKIKGRVNTASGNIDNNFTGKDAFVNITLFNAPDTATRKDGGSFLKPPPKYQMPGAPVFSAKVPVTSGKFEQTLLLPMNLPFEKPGVKLGAYAFKDTLMGSGSLQGLIFSGSETGNINDTAGPVISVKPVFDTVSMDQAGLFVKNRITAALPLTLEIRVFDESGVNVFGSGPDEWLTIEVSGSVSKRRVSFDDLKGDFRERFATYDFDKNTLKSGVHELIISAQDLFGNISRQTFTLEILDQTDIKLDHVLNIPNPVKMGRETRFYYYHSSTDKYNNADMTIVIRVYSLGGRLLAVIRNPRNGLAWIPRDGRGNILTPNVYLYQVSVTSAFLGKTTKSKIKKLVVHPPR